MFAIYRKEMRSYFINPIGYVYMGIFLVFSALLCCYTTIVAGSYNTSSYFTFLILTFIILIPILTMRLFAEERKLRTEQLLLTAPVTITGMVLGKYLAALTIFVSGVLLSCINFIPLYSIAAAERAGTSSTLNHIGPVTGEIVGSLIAVILMGAALIAVGTLVSALTENQLSAAIGTIGIILGFLLIGLVSSLIPAEYWIRYVFDFLSIFSRFQAFTAGYFDIAAIFYYISVAFIFIYLTVRIYDRRRYN